MFRTLLLALLLAAPAAQAASSTYGEPMPAGEAVPVALALADATPAPGAPRKFAGRITEVCQAKGCWVMLDDDGQAARVMMKGHAFAVPKDARGAAIVYGTLEVKTLDEATARHLAQDAGREAAAPTREYHIVATSVELTGG